MAVIQRDLRLAARVGGDMLTLVLFFVGVGIVVPFAVGPDRPLLTLLAPAIVWIAALLAQLLSIERLFRADHEDGTLMVMRHGSISLEAIVFAKLIAHWLTTALPLIAATPLLAVMLGMEWEAFWRVVLSLSLGTPGLVALGAVGAGVTVGLKRGGLVAPVLILPLCLPVLIFGVGAIVPSPMGGREAALLFLSGLSLASFVLAPFATALALKIAGE